MKKIAFVILNYNGIADTLSCLKSLEKMIIPKDISYQTFVVDNASADNSVKLLKNNKNIVLIESPTNKGFSGGNNLGIKMALEQGYDYVGLLNNDTTVDTYLLQNLLDGFSNSKVGVVVPKIYFMKGFEFHSDRYTKDEQGKVIWYAGGIMDWNNMIGSHRGVDEVDVGQFDTATNIEFATGCCMLASNRAWKEVGMLDEKYFLYYEDSDWSMRIKNCGYTIWYYPKAFIYHKNAGSTGGSGSSLQDYYIARNRLLFGIHYAPVKTKAHLLIEAGRLLTSGREWQKKGVNDFFMGRFGKGSYNTEIVDSR
jgi:GT2 family glycosyltransferase